MSDAAFFTGLPQKPRTTRQSLTWNRRYVRPLLCGLLFASPCALTRLATGVNELTPAQRAVVEPAYGYARPLLEDDGVGVVSPEREGQEAPVRSSQTHLL